jgi:hypothetical protein
MSSCHPQEAFSETVLKDVQQVGQVSVDSIGGQVKGFYTLALKNRDALIKHMVCKMKRRGSCSGGRDREGMCYTCNCHNSFQKRETSEGPSSIC